ncbi:MAG: hypothetical protein R3288_00370 [Woeseiaceae bacterium]|nr:hypothetical protein [Woeseiaceae bacterium]
MSDYMKSLQRTARVIVTLALTVFAGTAIAQAPGHLNVNTTVQKEVVVENEDGEKVRYLVPASTVVPGERVVYTITFENVGDEAAENVVITNPIAESLTYVAGSASNGTMRVEFSIDGGKTFAPASELTVVDGDDERPATTKDYTHVRWVMQSELQVGAKGSASFAAVLE